MHFGMHHKETWEFQFISEFMLFESFPGDKGHQLHNWFYVFRLVPSKVVLIATFLVILLLKSVEMVDFL